MRKRCEHVWLGERCNKSNDVYMSRTGKWLCKTCRERIRTNAAEPPARCADCGGSLEQAARGARRKRHGYDCVGAAPTLCHRCPTEIDKRTKHGLCRRCRPIRDRAFNNHRPYGLSVRHGSVDPMTTLVRMGLVSRASCWSCGNCYDVERRRYVDLQLDHHPQLGVLRGILCGDCNLGIGKFAEDARRLKRAIAWINDPQVPAGSVRYAGPRRSQAIKEQLVRDCGRACGICDEITIARNCHLDHEHESGWVRGILCSDCNTGLGQFREDAYRLRAAGKYLRGTEALIARAGYTPDEIARMRREVVVAEGKKQHAVGIVRGIDEHLHRCWPFSAISFNRPRLPCVPNRAPANWPEYVRLLLTTSGEGVGMAATGAPVSTILRWDGAKGRPGGMDGQAGVA